MVAKFEKKTTNTGVLTFEIPVAEVKKGLDVAFKRVQKRLSMPGFRKGKVPRQIFNNVYGEAALYEDALNALLPTHYSKAVEEAGLEVVAEPKIDIEKIEAGEPWVLTAEVTVKPEVKLGEYKNLTVEKQSREVTDEDVQAALESKRNGLAELVVKEAAAELGDTVVIDFEGFLNGEAFEGGKGENHSLELGSNSFIPGFEDQLVGKKAEDEVEVNVTFPENYQAEALAGQPAVFKVKVHEVKAKELPALDDEFAKDVDSEVDSLAELRTKTNLVLEAIVKAENIEVEAQEIEKEVAELAATYNMEAAQVKQFVTEDMLKADIRMKKAMKLIVDSVVEK